MKAVAISPTAPVLLLNSTYEALGTVTVKRAVRLLFSRKAEIIHDNGQLLHSGISRLTQETWKIPLPSIVRLLYYVSKGRKHVALTKKNVILRDDGKCGYCGKREDLNMLTVDHIQPVSRGGKSTWENLISCCRLCNSRKGNRTPEEAKMPLLRKPYRPKYLPFFVIKRNTMPDEWWKYLSLYSVGIEEGVETRS